jgi:alkylation response protein AidB-like acyl-CoA dehydrogenase
MSAASTFALDETQAMLRDSLSRFLTEQYDIELRERTLAAAERQPPLWHAFAQQLGLLGAGFSEANGGFGGGLRDHLIIMETLGQHLAAEPYLASVVQAGRLLEHAGGATAQRLLGQLIDGQALPVPALAEPGSRHDLDEAALRSALLPAPHGGPGWLLSGRKAVVHGAPWASHFIVLARQGEGLSLVALDAHHPAISRRDYRTVDGCRAAELAFDGVPVAPEQMLGAPGAALELLTPVQDAATLAACAEACGVLSRLLHDTVVYALERRQFGQPIAGFQVLQHRLADMQIALEQLQAVTDWAAGVFEAPATLAERQRAVSSAKVCAARACKVIGQGAVQLHGGMGMTEELAVGHYFRRATQLDQRLGSGSHHLRRVAALLES